MNDLLSRITVDPAICHGKPCVRGLRYPVENLLELLSSGMTIDDILVDYEDLEREDLSAALEYAARRIDHPSLAACGSGSTPTSPRRETGGNQGRLTRVTRRVASPPGSSQHEATMTW